MSHPAWRDSRCGVTAPPRVREGRETPPVGWVIVSSDGTFPNRSWLLCAACWHDVGLALLPPVAPVLASPATPELEPVTTP